MIALDSRASKDLFEYNIYNDYRLQYFAWMTSLKFIS